MKKSDLIKIIELVVRKEVKKQVNEIFIKENKSSLKSITPKPNRVKKIQKKEPVQYTENKALNEVLNETVGLSKGDSEMDEYPTMGGGTFDSTRATELLGYGNGLGLGADKETQRKVAAVQTMKEAGVSSEQLPDSVVNALTKDYSALMKHDKMKSKR